MKRIGGVVSGLSRLRSWSVAGLLFALVLALYLLTRYHLTDAPDRALLRSLTPSGFMLPSTLAVTWLGDTARRAIILVLALAVLLARGRRRAGAWLTVVTVGGTAANSAVKELVTRPRPDLMPHLDIVTSYSFPSGHAAGSMTLWLALALLAPARWRRATLTGAAALAMATGISRVALAVHWPSDVVAGWLFGLGWLLLWLPWLRRRDLGGAVDPP